MGARGPKSTPRAILKKRGSHRADQVKNQPTPESGRPRCPRWLSARAKIVWKELLPQLEDMGLLAKVDRFALVRYVTMLDRWEQSEKFIMQHGATYPFYGKEVDSQTGKKVAVGFKMFPQVKIAKELADQLLRIEASFGLSPSARTRINTDDQPVKKENNVIGKNRFFNAG